MGQRFSGRPAWSLFLAFGLVACAAHPTEHHEPTTPTELTTSSVGGPTNSPIDLLPNATAKGPRVSEAEIIKGSGSFVAPRSPQQLPANVGGGDGEITLNFVNADVADVAKAVLGDFLKLNYLVDASVQGTVTLTTSRPLPRAEVLPALETAFRLSGLALIEDNGTYRIVPIADAARGAGSARLVTNLSRPGFGVEIVPLRYIGAQQIQRLIEPMAPSGSVLTADTARNLLIISGSDQDRAAIVDNIKLFDVDWMAGMSFALFPLHSVDAKTVVTELNQVMGTKDGPMAGMLRLSPIDRLNAVLAISPQAKYLETLRSWIDRFDQTQASTDRKLYVYYVQNGRAADLASVLSNVLGSGDSSTKGQKTASSTTSGTNDAVPEPVLSQLTGPSNQLPAPPFGNSLSGSQNTTSDSGGSQTTASGAQGQPQSDIRITADETTNALLILASQREYEIVESALKKLDIAPLQVLLEAAVAEVTLTDQLQFGVQYSFNVGRNNQFVQSAGASTTIAPQLPGFAYIFSPNSNIQATLNALDAITHVDVISAPNVLVLNNQTATLQVGDQVPIATQSAVATTAANAPVVNSIEYRDTGIILKVTPRVNESGLVMMDIAQEVSNVSSTTTSSLDSPTIEERKISSTVAVQDGETIGLGGLISDSRTRGRNGIPLLQDIPYLGNLFGQTNNSSTRTELLILITPHVVQGVQRLRAATEELKLKMPSTLPLFPTP